MMGLGGTWIFKWGWVSSTSVEQRRCGVAEDGKILDSIMTTFSVFVAYV